MELRRITIVRARHSFVYNPSSTHIILENARAHSFRRHYRRIVCGRRDGRDGRCARDATNT